MFRKYTWLKFCVEQVVNFLFVIIDSSLKFHVMRLLISDMVKCKLRVAGYESLVTR